MRAGRVQARPAETDEIHALCASVRRQLANAWVVGLTPDGRLQHIYSAVRQAATIALRAEGYRTRGYGHHETTFQALAVIGPPLSQHARFCQALRIKRIDIEYSGEDLDAEEVMTALRKAEALIDEVRRWLPLAHPGLAGRVGS